MVGHFRVLKKSGWKVVGHVRVLKKVIEKWLALFACSKKWSPPRPLLQLEPPTPPIAVEICFVIAPRLLIARSLPEPRAFGEPSPCQNTDAHSHQYPLPRGDARAGATHARPPRVDVRALPPAQPDDATTHPQSERTLPLARELLRKMQQSFAFPR